MRHAAAPCGCYGCSRSWAWTISLELIPFRSLLAGEHRTEEYLALHPLGQVPLLIDGETQLFESGAICAWLAEQHPDAGLAPRLDHPLRGSWQQWMFFAVATLEPPAWTLLQHTRMLPAEKRNAPALASATRRYREALSVLEDEFADGRDWLLGNAFSSADILCVTTLQWSRGQLDHYPALRAWSARALARPAYRRANRIR